MDKKEFLSRYHNLQEMIERKKKYIEFCAQRASSVSSPSFSDERVDISPSYEAPFVKWRNKEMDAERELKDLEKQAEEAKCEIESVIAKLDSDEYKMLLLYRYIDWMLWIEIASKLCCSLQTVYRWHREALNKIDTT